MGYYQKEWNLYVARFLMKSVTKDNNENIVNKSYYIDLQLFQFDSPEGAYNEITAMIQNQSLSSSYRDDAGGIIELSCMGLNDLERLQTNIRLLKETLETKSYGVELAIINLDEIKKAVAGLVTKKENLKLFE